MPPRSKSRGRAQKDKARDGDSGRRDRNDYDRRRLDQDEGADSSQNERRKRGRRGRSRSRSRQNQQHGSNASSGGWPSASSGGGGKASQGWPAASQGQGQGWPAAEQATHAWAVPGFYKWKEEATQLKKKVEELESAASKQPSIISQGVSSAMQMLGFRPGVQGAPGSLGGQDGMLGPPPPMGPPPMPPVMFPPGGQPVAQPPGPPFPPYGAAQPQPWAAGDWHQGIGGAGTQRPQEPVWHHFAAPGSGGPSMGAGAMDLTKSCLGLGQAPNPYTFAGGGGQVGSAALGRQGLAEKGVSGADVQKSAVEVTIDALLRRGLLQPGAGRADPLLPPAHGPQGAAGNWPAGGGADAHAANADARAGAAQHVQSDQSNRALAFLHELLAGASAPAGTAGPPPGANDSGPGRGRRRSEAGSPSDKALRRPDEAQHRSARRSAGRSAGRGSGSGSGRPVQLAQLSKGGLPLRDRRQRSASPTEDPSADDESGHCRRPAKSHRSRGRESAARSRSASTGSRARESSRRDASPPAAPIPRKLAKPVADTAAAGTAPSSAATTAEEAIPAAQWQKAASTVKELLDIEEIKEEPPLTKLEETQAWILWAAAQQCVTAKSLNAALQENEIECKDRAKVGKLRRLLWFAVGL